MIKQKPKILVVDDKPENLYTMEKLLKRLDVEVVQTTSGAEALTLSLKHDFCLAIVDVQMPEMDGYELVELLRSNKSTKPCPSSLSAPSTPTSIITIRATKPGR